MWGKIKKNMALFWFYRELLWNLANREITQRYKQSILGYAWVILNPLLQMIVLSFVFSVVLRVNSYGVPYIVFLSIALLPWNLFVQSLSSSTSSLITNSTLITKIYFPREILVYSTVIAKLIDFIYSLIILVGFFFVFQIQVNINVFLIIPILIIQIIFMSGLSLLFAALNLFYRDIQYLLNLIITLWMYATPIMYPAEIVPQKYRSMLALNPMSVFINAYREILLSKGDINYNSLGLALLISITLFIASFYLFKKLEGQFADYV